MLRAFKPRNTIFPVSHCRTVVSAYLRRSNMSKLNGLGFRFFETIKVLFIVRYSKRQITFFANNNTITKIAGKWDCPNLEICIKKAELSDFKGKKVNLKVRLSMYRNTYKTMYFDRNISKIRMATKSEGSYSSCELNKEIYFKGQTKSK